MSTLTIKEIAPKIENHWYCRTKCKWTKKDTNYIAKQYKDFCWYADNVCNHFPDAEIRLATHTSRNNDQYQVLEFNYGSGGAKINIEHMDLDILIPLIEDICQRHNKRLAIESNQTLAA